MENKYPMFEAMRNAYAQGQEDETLLPLVLTTNHGNSLGRISDGDSVIFYNIRGEREIELTRSLTEDNFKEFPVEKSMHLNFATMIEYQKDLNVDAAFPPDEIIKDTLSEIIANNKIKVKVAIFGCKSSFFIFSPSVYNCVCKTYLRFVTFSGKLMKNI